MIQKISSWILYSSLIAFMFSRLMLSYEMYLFHLKDLQDDHHYNSLCMGNEMPKKYEYSCNQAGIGVQTPLMLRIIKDTINHTVQEIVTLGSASYSFIGMTCFLCILVIWMLSSIFNKISSRNPNFIIPITYDNTFQHRQYPRPTIVD